MRPGAILAVALVLAAVPSAGQGIVRGREGGGEGRVRRRRAVPSEPAPRERREESPAPSERRSEPARAEPVRPEKERRARGEAGPSHAAPSRERTLSGGLTSQERVEIVPGRHYWHRAGAVRYTHYYDGRLHWYGFYHGPRFYWTRWYGRRWWWWDAGYGRWLYWWDGWWWWPGPGGAVYVYVDGSYSPYEPAPASSGAPPPPAGGSRTASPDGKRVVQISADGQAFLYDASGGGDPLFLKYLGAGATGARFSGGADGEPLRVLVELSDGGFALFDADGASVDAAKRSEPSAPPPDAPENVPPPPTSAPGE